MPNMVHEANGTFNKSELKSIQDSAGDFNYFPL